MSLGTFFKQPADKLDYDINCAEWLTRGDNLAEANVVIEPAGLLNTATYVFDPIVKIWLEGGTDGVTYRITVNIKTVDGRKKQTEFKVKVKDT